MVIDDDEYDQIRETNEYKISLKNWEIEYPNLKEIHKSIRGRITAEQAKLDMGNGTSHQTQRSFTERRPYKRTGEEI